MGSTPESFDRAPSRQEDQQEQRAPQKGPNRKVFFALLAVVFLLSCPSFICGGDFVLALSSKPAELGWCTSFMLDITFPLSMAALVVSAGASFGNRLSGLQKAGLWIVTIAGIVPMLSLWLLEFTLGWLAGKEVLK